MKTLIYYLSNYLHADWNRFTESFAGSGHNYKTYVAVSANNNPAPKTPKKPEPPITPTVLISFSTNKYHFYIILYKSIPFEYFI